MSATVPFSGRLHEIGIPARRWRFAAALALLGSCSSGSDSLARGEAREAFAMPLAQAQAELVPTQPETPQEPQEASKGEPRSGEVDILSYNIKGLPFGLSRFDPAATAHLIGPYMNEFDVVLLQEDFAFHELVVELATHAYRSIPKVVSFGLVNDGLNRLSRLPLGELTRVAWIDRHGMFYDGAGDQMGEKGFSLSTLELASGVLIDLYNMHGEAGRGEGDQRARRAGYAQFIEFVAERSRGRAIIVGGDTNLKWRNEGDVAILAELEQRLGLVEVSRLLGITRDSVDRFFFRSNAEIEIEPKALAWRKDFVDEDGKRLSDHDPLVASFRWRLKN